MSHHRFAVGESVLCTRRHLSDTRWRRPFTVLACLATDDLIPQYQISSPGGVFERQASEYELSRTPLPQRGFLWMNEAFFSETDDVQPANANLVPTHQLPRAAWHKNDGRQASASRHG
jgi:hypothetical protein